MYPLRARNSHLCVFSISLTLFLTQCQQNKVGKIIILYDEDERIAPNAATTFVQRGVDNVFMLSGGTRWIVLYICPHFS